MTRRSPQKIIPTRNPRKRAKKAIPKALGYKPDTGNTTPPIPMLVIPQQNLQTVCDWLNSDRMTMPQSEARSCLNLLLAAKPVEDN